MSNAGGGSGRLLCPSMLRRTFIHLVALFASPAFAGEFDTVVPMSDKGASAFFVDADIEGFGAVQFMVDTGAGYTTINQEVLQALEANGHATYVKSLAGRLANGERVVVPVYQLTAITLGNGCRLNDIEAAVFPHTKRYLLGMSALRQAAPFAFSVDPPQLRLSDCGKQAS